MAALVVTGAQVLLGSSDISGFTGAVDGTPATVGTVDVTTMTSGGFVALQAALRSGTFGVSGFADFTTLTGISDLFTPTALGTQYAATVNPTGGVAVGDKSVFTRGILSTYTPWGGAMGEAAKFQMGLTTDTTPNVSGFILAPLASRGALTGTQVSSVPTISATQRMWAVLHVTGAVGTTLTVKVQSTTTGDSGFASPTDRITFTATSAIGWQFSSVAGAITDTRWRVVATVGTSTFTWFCAVGIA